MIALCLHYEKESAPARNLTIQTGARGRVGSWQELPNGPLHQGSMVRRSQIYPRLSNSHAGAEFGAKLLDLHNIAGSRVKLVLWDTAGQEKYRAIVRNFYRNSSAVLLVYNLTKFVQCYAENIPLNS